MEARCSPSTLLPLRHAAEIAAGAGPLGDVVWEVLDPAWAPLRTLATDPDRDRFEEWTLGFDTLVTPTDADAYPGVKRWHHLLGTVGALLEHRDPTTRELVRGEHLAVEVARRHASRQRTSIAVVSRRRFPSVARVAVGVLEHPAGLRAAFNRVDGLYIVTSPEAQSDMHDGMRVRHLDVWGAVLGAVLAARGEPQLRTALQLAAGVGEWSLSELIATAEVTAPSR